MSGLIGLSALADDARAAIQGGGSDRLGLTPTGVKTANYTAAAGDFVPVDTTSGNVTVTFPAAPADAAVVAVKHIAQGGSNTVGLALSGSDRFNTASGATTGTLTLLNQGVIVQYKASLGVWYVVADDLPLTGLSSIYAPILNVQLTAWALANAFRVVSATRDANGAITTASVVWPDGSTGTFTTDTASTAFPGAIDAYHVTYVNATTGTKTVTQAAVTRDATTGAVTAQPALVVA